MDSEAWLRAELEYWKRLAEDLELKVQELECRVDPYSNDGDPPCNFDDD